LHGGGNSVRSFIHIRDVATATLKIAQENTVGEAYHISTDLYISIRDLVELICKMMKADFTKAVEIVDERPGKDAAYLLDSSKLRKGVGWIDRIKLEDGIRETIGWVNDNLEELKKQPSEYVHKK
jgi:dTDP-glucose 4,6-dehydratase